MRFGLRGPSKRIKESERIRFGNAEGRPGPKNNCSTRMDRGAGRLEQFAPQFPASLPVDRNELSTRKFCRFVRSGPIRSYFIQLVRILNIERYKFARLALNRIMISCGRCARECNSKLSNRWSQLSGSNRRPTVYKTVALPLS
jgi:hypothetical protein